MRMLLKTLFIPLVAALAATPSTLAQYVNFESSQVHPIAITPSGGRLLTVNTPDARLEVFRVASDGSLRPLQSIPVGLEPVTVVARTEDEAWVVNNLSDTISIVDLGAGGTVRTLPVGDEPTDVAFAAGRAFVAVAGENLVKVFALSNLAAPPLTIDIFSSKPRALAVSADGSKVYAVPLHSGNQTTVVNANVIATNNPGLNLTRLSQLGLNTTACASPPPPYPPLPDGVARNPALTDPAPPAQPPVGLIVRWDAVHGHWRDEAGQDWTPCLPFRLPDHDLFVIDANNPGPPSLVDHLGTTLFDVSVNPANGRIYVPNTEARNMTRFELPLGLRGHIVDDRLSVVDPNAGNTVTIIDLNTHIDRASDPAANAAERLASISQPGMMVWNAAGTTAWLTAIGSRKVFRVDGSCLSGGCIFGASRPFPDAVEVGEGPAGVALSEAHDRLYVLDRFSNSVAVVGATSMTKMAEVALHDPSSDDVKNGRRLLYDAIEGSGHGDAACSSCHISGDRDAIAWDLGDPTGSMVAYGTTGDNVKFIIPAGNQPTECPPSQCAAHAGFDPQKGPMTTQTLRGMLEPLHWRGDRPTMLDFNMAFVSLMGTQDIGPVNGKPAGLTASDMDLYRRFALRIAFPPNPFRTLDDLEPNTVIQVPGQPLSGNPAVGRAVFLTGQTDAGQSCSACHALPFGAAGGKLLGVEPGDPRSALAGLFNGTADGSPHSDLKVPHLRNMYEKFGPRFGSHTDPSDPPANQRSGFGFTHDGSVPDMGTFLSAGVFTITAQQVRDLSMFMFLFPTGTRPAVGRNLTVPPGPPADPNAPPETLLSALIALGNAADPNRHCELAASVAGTGGGAVRGYLLDGGALSGGLWTTDRAAEPQVTTTQLRTDANGPLTFVCGTTGSGARLAIDRDLDGARNGDDCSDDDPAFSAAPVDVTGLTLGAATPPLLTWDDQGSAVGPSVFYEVAGGSLSDLIPLGLAVSTSCLSGPLDSAVFDDARPDPPLGDGYFYLVRARTPECSGGFAPGRTALESLDCSAF